MVYDAIIIGGSYAGQSAGLQLARARRSILVIDAGLRRNRFAAASHGFLTQDGVPPADIAAEGRAQLMEYGTVDWLQAEVEQVARLDDRFEVRLRTGGSRTSRRLILAAGGQDVLPDLPGLPERWGRQVFHCPYCHGYELQQGRIGVLATSPLSVHQALLLADWGTTTLFLHDQAEPEAADLQRLAARGVAIERARVARLQGETLTLVTEDGRAFGLDGLFVATQVRPSPLAEQIGCELEHGPMGSFVKTDATKATSVAGVFACGDVARPAGSMALAVGDGAMAGAATHRSLVFQ